MAFWNNKTHLFRCSINWATVSIIGETGGTQTHDQRLNRQFMFCCVRLLVFRAIFQASFNGGYLQPLIVLTFLELSKLCYTFPALFGPVSLFGSGQWFRASISDLHMSGHYRLALCSFYFIPRRELDFWGGVTPTIVSFYPLIVFRSGYGYGKPCFSWHYLLYQREGCMQWYVLIFVSFVPSFNLFLQVWLVFCINSIIAKESTFRWFFINWCCVMFHFHVSLFFFKWYTRQDSNLQPRD